MFKRKYVRDAGDDLSLYEVIFNSPTTIAEFIQDLRNPLREETGYIAVEKDGNMPTFGKPKCQYISENLPSEYMGRTITYATAIVGWGTANYSIYIM